MLRKAGAAPWSALAMAARSERFMAAFLAVIGTDRVTHYLRAAGEAKTIAAKREGAA